LLCRDGVDGSGARRSFRLDAAEGTSWRWICSSAFLVLGDNINIAVIFIVVVVLVVLIV